MTANFKEKGFEILIVIIGGIGLFILITGLYNTPSFIAGKIISFFHLRF